ncbi:MAG: hypothetical protein GXY37_01275, partial [Chloroflexi bacterium]|nr:hypothetical protein [Chloroflexota bacterium]
MSKFNTRSFLVLILTGFVLLGHHQIGLAQEDKLNEDSDLPFVIFDENMDSHRFWIGSKMEDLGIEMYCQYPGNESNAFIDLFDHEIWCSMPERYIETGNTFEKSPNDIRKEEIAYEYALYVYTTRGTRGSIDTPKDGFTSITYGEFSEFVANYDLSSLNQEIFSEEGDLAYSDFTEIMFPLNNASSHHLPAIYIDITKNYSRAKDFHRLMCVAEERDENALCSIIAIDVFTYTNYQGDYKSYDQAISSDLWDLANSFRIRLAGESESQTGNEVGTPWVTVVGAIAAGGVAVGAAARALAARAKRKNPSTRKNKKDQNEDDEPAGYILQISQDHLQINQNQPANLEATVWEVNKQGGYKLASKADLSVEQPANTNFLNITPRRAQGSLKSNLSIAGKVTNLSFQLNVIGRVGGTSSSAQVNIDIESEIAIKIETSDNRRTLRTDGKDGLNVYACVVVEGETDEKKLEAAQESLEFSISGVGKTWLETSEKTKEGEWQYIY